MNSLYESVADVICTRFKIDKDLVRPETNWVDIDLDSLSLIELATAVNKKFGVEFSDDEMDEIWTVSQLVDKLAEKLDINRATI